VRADRYPAGRFPWWLVAVCALILGTGYTIGHHVGPRAAPAYAAPELYSPGTAAPSHPVVHGLAPAVAPTVTVSAPSPRVPARVPVADSTALTSLSAPAPAYPSVTGLTIPALGINTGLVIKVGVQSDGSMETPPLSRVQELGWFCPNAHTANPGCGAPLPGEPGPATLVAHVDGQGKRGLFAKLSQLKAGDEVTVRRSDHKVATFTVTELAMDDKTSFPGQQIFGDTADPELRLITCGGPFDPAARSYTQNVVVSARLTALRAAG
jgi:hypothetical protein